MLTITISPIEFDGKLYYTVEQFAALTKLSQKTIYLLAREGNRIRPLKSVVFDKKLRILASEFTNYPFMGDGRFPFKKAYKFNEDGTKRELTEEEVSHELAR
jgi:hypothetical protein